MRPVVRGQNQTQAATRRQERVFLRCYRPRHTPEWAEVAYNRLAINRARRMAFSFSPGIIRMSISTLTSPFEKAR